MIERFGRVVEPEEMTELAGSIRPPLAPNALSRMSRDLEPPTSDEGFADVEVVPFVRDHPTGGKPGIAIAIDALERTSGDGGHEGHIGRLLDDAPQRPLPPLRVETRCGRRFARRHRCACKDGSSDGAFGRNCRLPSSGGPSDLLVSPSTARDVSGVCEVPRCQPSCEHLVRPERHQSTDRGRAGDVVRGARTLGRLARQRRRRRAPSAAQPVEKPVIS